MKKLLLSLTLLFGFAIAYAAPVDVVFTGDPANGGTVRSIPDNVVTLTFTNVTRVTISDDATDTDIQAKLDGSEYNFQNMKATGNTFMFSIGRMNPISSGTVVITFAQGCLELDGNPNKAFSYTFTVDPNATITEPVVFTPEDGATLSVISTITVKVPGVVSQAEDESLKASLVNTANNQTIELEFPELDGETIVCNFSKAGITEPGTYKFTIPAGMYWIGTYGEEDQGNSPEYSATYTISAPAANTIDFASVLLSILPDEEDEDYTPLEMWGEGEIKTMLTINGSVAINNACTEKIVMKRNGTVVGSELGVDSPYIVMDGGPSIMNTRADAVSMIQMFFNPDDENATLKSGTYTLEIPAGFFKIGEDELSAYSKSWKVIAGPTQFNLSWTPEVNSDIDLKNPDKKAISSSGYWINIYTATSGLMDPNDTTGAYKVIEEKAVLTNEDGDAVAEFSNDPGKNQIQSRQGNIIWNIRNAALDPKIKQNGINLNGKYTLTVPEGFLQTSDGTPIVAQTVSWNVVGGVDPQVEQIYTTSPEPGAYKEYPTVTLTYENCTKIELNGTPTASVTLSNSVLGNCTITTDGVNKVTFTPTEPITTIAPSEYSVYRLVIPAEAYTLTINNIEVKNLAITLENTYTITLPAPDPLTITPETGTTVASTDDLKYIYYSTEQTVTFDAAKKVRLYPVIDGVRATEPVASYNRTAYDEQKGEFYMMTDEDGNYPELEEGTYDLVIPVGFYRMEIGGTSRSNELQVITYVISKVAPKEYTFKFTPAEGEIVTVELEDLFVEVEGAETVEALLPLVLTNGEESFNIVAAPATGLTVNYMVTTQTITNGEWTAKLAPNSLKIDGENYLKEISWKFTLDVIGAVEGIFADAESVNVYTLSGTAVLIGAAPEQLNNLEPGIYIINGKTVIIRK